MVDKTALNSYILTEVNMARRILCVCMTNLSFSPILALALNEHCKNRPSRACRKFESAGLLRCTAGMTVNEPVKKIAQRHGLDLDCYRARFVGELGDLRGYSMVVLKSKSEYRMFDDLYPGFPRRRVFLLSHFSDMHALPTPNSPCEADEFDEVLFKSISSLADAIG
jgi:protein-tyrosine-phosphatase